MSQATKIFDIKQLQKTIVPVENPMTGEILYHLQCASNAEVQTSFARSAQAFQTLKAMSMNERVAMLKRLKQSILKHQDAIFTHTHQESGKPKFEAIMADVLGTVTSINYLIKHVKSVLKEETVKTPALLFGKKSKVYYEPMGPVLIISPWNYPFYLSMVPAITALAAGNSVLIKPSEFTPLYGLYEQILNDADLPKDAIQIVYGDKVTGAHCVEAQPAKILFTGSSTSGSKVMMAAAKHLIPVELELGGKDPMLVFEDANIDRATDAAMWGGLYKNGQTCTAIERVIVQEDVYDKFVSQLASKMKQIKTPSSANKYDDLTYIDYSVINPEFQIQKLQQQIDDAVTKGAKIILGGKRIGTTHEIEPTIITNISPGILINDEETFGPIVTIEKFSTEQEGIQKANSTPFGLSACVWGKDQKRTKRAARAIESGMMVINNTMINFANPNLPFGGRKQSGMG